MTSDRVKQVLIGICGDGADLALHALAAADRWTPPRLFTLPLLAVFALALVPLVFLVGCGVRLVRRVRGS
jgi:hypothetical protein